MAKILICEDDPSHAKAFADKLARYGFEPQVASDGEACVQMAKQTHPDLILLDLVLPQKNGFEVLREVRAEKELADVNVVIVSNLSEDRDIKETLSMGARDYFVKSQHPISEIIGKVLDLLSPK